MSPDPATEMQVAALREKLSDIEGTARVTKHEIANIRQIQITDGVRMDKMENRLEKFEEKMSDKLEAILDKISDINVKQEKGISFYAGIVAVFTTGGGLLLAIGKLLFGAHS